MLFVDLHEMVSNVMQSMIMLNIRLLCVFISCLEILKMESFFVLLSVLNDGHRTQYATKRVFACVCNDFVWLALGQLANGFDISRGVVFRRRCPSGNYLRDGSDSQTLDCKPISYDAKCGSDSPNGVNELFKLKVGDSFSCALPFVCWIPSYV